MSLIQSLALFLAVCSEQQGQDPQAEAHHPI